MRISDPTIERLLVGSPLRQPTFARKVLTILLIIVAIAITMFIFLVFRMRPGTSQVFFSAIAIASIASLMPITILWFLDRRERESPWMYAAILLWGAFIATGLALPLNNTLLDLVEQWINLNPDVGNYLGPDAPMLIGAPLVAPLVEEITKGLGIILLFVLFRSEYDNMRDGFIYGALVGIGFNWFEAPLYVAKGFAEYGVAPWGFQFGARYALFGMAGHALYSGLFGLFLGWARQTSRAWWRILAPLVGLVLAMAAHALNNGLGLLVVIAQGGTDPAASNESSGPPIMSFLMAWLLMSGFYLILFIPFFILLLILLWQSGKWERRVIQTELADEVGHSITAEEYQQIINDGIFRTRRINRINRQQSRNLVNAQHELAFRKWRVRQDGQDLQNDPLIQSWRLEIERLRQVS